MVLDNVDLIFVPWWAFLHIAELDLYLAVIPFAATSLAVIRGFQSRAEPATRLFAALVIPVSGGLVLAVAAYSSEPHAGAVGFMASEARLHERATFVLAPLFLIGLMLELTRSAVSRNRLVVAGIVAALLPTFIPFQASLPNANFQALALVPWTPVRDVLPWPLACIAVTGVLAALYIGRARMAVIVAAIAAVFCVTTLSAAAAQEVTSESTRDVGWGSSSNWIDRVAGDQTITVLWAEPGGRSFVAPAARHRVLWLGELFNRSVGDVFELGTPMPYGLPSTRVQLKRGRVSLADGRPAPLGELVLAPCHVHVEGVRIARDATTGAAVVRVSHPVRATVVPPASCNESGAQ